MSKGALALPPPTPKVPKANGSTKIASKNASASAKQQTSGSVSKAKTAANGDISRQSQHQRQSPSPQSRRRHNSAKQLYQRYVAKSSIFAVPSANSTCNGRWPQVPHVPGGGQNGLGSVRSYDSTPTSAQLEWNKQRRAQVRQQAMCAPVGTLNGPKIVQRHAEMRSYLLHCQRVLNARPLVNTGRAKTPNRGELGMGMAYSSSVGASMLGTPVGGGRHIITENNDFWLPDGIVPAEELAFGRAHPAQRARSVPTSAAANRRRQQQRMESEQQGKLRAENRQLLERLVQISLRSPGTASSLLPSRQSSGGMARGKMTAQPQQNREQQVVPGRRNNILSSSSGSAATPSNRGARRRTEEDRKGTSDWEDDDDGNSGGR